MRIDGVAGIWGIVILVVLLFVAYKFGQRGTLG